MGVVALGAFFTVSAARRATVINCCTRIAADWAGINYIRGDILVVYDDKVLKTDLDKAVISLTRITHDIAGLFVYSMAEHLICCKARIPGDFRACGTAGNKILATDTTEIWH